VSQGVEMYCGAVTNDVTGRVVRTRVCKTCNNYIAVTYAQDLDQPRSIAHISGLRIMSRMEGLCRITFATCSNISNNLQSVTDGWLKGPKD
jgi:hypothetical protein